MLRKALLTMFVVATSVFLSACNPLEKKNKSGLQVITNDIPAAVYLDGQHVDKTPFINKDLKPGSYTLKIQPDDPKLVSYETSIELRKGLLSVVTWKPGTRPEYSGGVTYELEKLPNKKATEVAIVSVPDGAIVSVDGGEKQFAPLIIDTITPDKHEIEASLPSYETQKHTFNVVQGHRLNISIKLAKTPFEAPPEENRKLDSQPATASSGVSLSTSNPTTPSTFSARTASASAQTITFGKRVKIKATGFTKDGREGVRVREASSSSSREIGFALTGQEYPLVANEPGWFHISLDSTKGWINALYGEIIE